MLLQRREITLWIVMLACGLAGGVVGAVSMRLGSGPLAAFVVGMAVAGCAFGILVLAAVAAVRDKFKL